MLLISNQLIGEEKNFKRNFWQCDEWVFFSDELKKIEFSSQTGLNTLYLTIRLCRQY